MKNPAALKSACKDFEEDLVLYYYGEGGAAERQRVERHVSGCVCCRRFVDDLQRLLPQMTESQELPQTFWDKYLRETVAKLAEQEEKKFCWRSLLARRVHPSRIAIPRVRPRGVRLRVTRRI